MAWTDYAVAISNMAMAAACVFQVIVSYRSKFRPSSPSPRHTSCSAVTEVNALRRKLEAQELRLTELEVLKERYLRDLPLTPAGAYDATDIIQFYSDL